MFELEPIVRIAQEAGERIMQVYQRGFGVAHKDDSSPVTEADLAAHRHIVAGLNQLTPDIPVLSEESTAEEIAQRQNWPKLWLVDPLDGTKEFIKRNDEFTVNIALIEHGIPVAGVVHAPALGVTYAGQSGAGAYKLLADGSQLLIQVAAAPGAGTNWRVVGSRSHASEAVHTFLQRLPNAELVSMGSSLKLCLVAEGQADLYPRLGPTCEWDTAAAQAVVEAAGGQVLSWPDLQPLRYNQRHDTLLNPYFIVCAGLHPDWLNADQTHVLR